MRRKDLSTAAGRHKKQDNLMQDPPGELRVYQSKDPNTPSAGNGLDVEPCPSGSAPPRNSPPSRPPEQQFDDLVIRRGRPAVEELRLLDRFSNFSRVVCDD